MISTLRQLCNSMFRWSVAAMANELGRRIHNLHKSVSLAERQMAEVSFGWYLLLFDDNKRRVAMGSERAVRDLAAGLAAAKGRCVLVTRVIGRYHAPTCARKDGSGASRAEAN
jgi:hypothetical protein